MNEEASEASQLRDQIEALELERDQLEDLLSDAENYLQHKPICSRLLTKKDCDCGLVELMTRVHELEREEDDTDEETDEDESEDDADEEKHE